MKKVTRKILALILSSVLLLAEIPVYAFEDMPSEESCVAEMAEEEQVVSENEEETRVAFELPEKRESNIKHFRMTNGTIIAAVYPYEVHYTDSDGVLQDIDNSLVAEKDGSDAVLSNQKNSTYVKFMKKSNPNKLYTIDQDDYKIKVSIDGVSKVSAVVESSDAKRNDNQLYVLDNLSSQITYENILKNIDIQYKLVGKQLKENIIIKKEVDFQSLTYNYHLNGSLEAVQENERTIILHEAGEEKEVLHISAPVMWDAKGNYYEGLSLELIEQKNSKLQVRLHWEMPKKINYPVTIDPVMSFSTNRNNIQDTHIIAGYPTTNYDYNNHIRVRNDGYAMLKFPLPSLNSGDKIVNAQLLLAPYGAVDNSLSIYSNENSYDPPLYITTHKILRSWEETTATYQNVDPENDFYDSRVYSYRVVDGNDSYYTWDITALAGDWAEGRAGNYGVLLKYDGNPSDGSVFDSFFCSTNGAFTDSSLWPQILFQYINTTGVEDYYSYHTQDLGCAGTGYTNDFTGNLTIINPILQTGGSLMPITVSMVYNTNNVNASQTPYGTGWKLNWHQKIDWSVKSNYDSTQYVKYEDGDGTCHFFTIDSATGIWTDEVYPDRKIYYISSSGDYRMTDSSGTDIYFKRNGSLNEWYLYKVVDEYGNYIQLDLNESSMKKVEQISSSTGNIVKFQYSTYGFLTDIIYYDGDTEKTIEIDYNNHVQNHNNGVSDITYADGSNVEYHYYNNTKYLSKAFDITGCNTVYNYHWNGKMRVDTITTYDNSAPAVRGDRLVMNYEGTTTTVTDEIKERKYLYTFAQTGTLKSVVDVTDNDGNGYGQYYEYNNNNASTSTGKGNLTFLSKTQKSTVNLLKNHSFEGTTSLPTFQVWNETEGTSSGQVTTSKKNMGSKSYRLYRHEQSNSPRVLAYYTKTLEAGETYTLSAYVNTSEMTSKGKGASLYVRNSSFNAESEYVTESKDEWQRIFLTFTVPTTGTVSICMSLCGATGAVCFDNIQLETGDLSDYNLLENAGFEEDTSSIPRGWVASNNKGSISETHKIAGNRALYIAGTITKHKHYYQSVSIPDGKEGDTYVMSAFSKGASVPTLGYKYTLMLRFLKSGSIVNESKVLFNEQTTGWQKLSGVAKAKGDYDSIQFWLLYYNNSNEVYFDNAQLTRDTFGNTYTYDSNGNLISTTDLQDKEEYTFKYDGNNQLIKEKNISGGKILYSYNSSKKQQLDAVTGGGVSTHYNYDAKGNVTSSATIGSGLVDGELYYIQSVYYSKYIHVTNSGTASGTQVGLADYAKNSAQRWKLIKNADGSYSFSPECAEGKLLSVNGSSLGNSVNFALYSSGEKTYQKFKLVKRYGNIYCLDIAENTNYAMDCNGTNIYTYKMHHGEVQQFALIPVSDSNSTANPSVVSSATYTANGAYVESITDSRGNATNYEFNQDRGYLVSQTNPNGVRTAYSYYDNELLKSVSLSDGTNDTTVNYTYDAYHRLNTITAPSGTSYSFLYDSFGRNITVKLGDDILSQYLYDSKGRTDTVTYGNGNTVQYGYDELNRQTEVNINGTSRYTKQYDGNSRLLQTEDILLGKRIQYEYDILNRTVAEKLIDAETNTVRAKLQVRYDDSKNRVAGYDVHMEGEENATDYVYGENQTSPDTVTSIKQNGLTKLSYGYDVLNRPVTRNLATDTPFVTEYTYCAGRDRDSAKESETLTTYLVKTLKNGSDIWEYSYDKLGNITQIKKNDTQIESYAYDNLNQLITMVKGEDVYAYTYDAGGNLLSTIKNGVIENTYGYDNTDWKDLLTSYNGQTITYDAIGNPLTYRDGMNLTWSDGRKLTTIIKGTDSISYTYDANGLRTSKTVNAVETEYYWLDSTLYAQKTDGEILYFLYDENGTAYGFILEENEEKSYYYYEFNVQGDIIGIIDSTGARVVEYTYDVWGKPLSIAGTQAETIGQLNPLRYRGYYYDAETGFYYVSSRYYDPEIGRFISADGEISGIGGNVLGYNLFAYCFNNPVNYSDPTGNWPKLSTIFKGVAVAAAALAVVAACVVAAPVLAGVGVASGLAATAASVATTALCVLGVASTAAIVTSVVENTSRKKNTRDQSVYVMKNQSDEVAYVGRTNDPSRRQREHEKDIRKADLQPLEVVFTGLTKNQARVVEQVLISAYGINNLYNARREIAVGNISKYSEYVGSTISLFGSFYESEMLNLMGR